MSVSIDLLFQNLQTVQDKQQPFPPTIASATTISPTSKMTFVTGTTQVANITPPTTGYAEVTLCFTNAAPGAFLTNGASYPIKTAYQPIQNRPIDLCYIPQEKMWYVKAVV